jgi:NADPH-dependent glutamate synthase beta subunit-like oxidoreductase/formate hydrogenlyase subunit 6/NADH:ubiquinone oxidoreductase subunit I
MGDGWQIADSGGRSDLARDVLIVGSAAAGVRAALDLADAGLRVHLVEPSPFLGGAGSRSVHLILAGEDATPAADRNCDGRVPPQQVAELLEVVKHPRITVWADAVVNRLTGEGTDLHAEIHSWPRYVDAQKCTACGDCEEVCPVIVPGEGHTAIHKLPGVSVPNFYTIDKLGVAPCSNTCPGGIHVQGYVTLIAAGRYGEALDLIREAVPFPGILGRVCHHPCEANCRRAEVDQAVSIRNLKRFVADWDHTSDLPSPQPSTGKHVAVVGSGPSGLTVAYELAKRGHAVTVFEALPVVGGMMAVGIPAYRLPREVIHREVERIQALGVEIRCNTRIGKDGDLSVDDLLEKYDAVFLGIGAHQSRSLSIPGEDLAGVVQGIDLLRAISLTQQLPDSGWPERLAKLLPAHVQRVAVIGGGNTAMDVARSLLRQGVRDVRVLYRRSRAEMPAIPDEVADAEHEGIPIEFLSQPIRVTAEDERVVGLECVRMKLGELDKSGRCRPIPIAGTEFVVDADLVVLALGQQPDLDFLGDAVSEYTITREGNLNADQVTHMTGRPGVFAAGDAIGQPWSVIDAIGTGKQAAQGIDAFLRGIRLEDELVVDAQVTVARRELLPEEKVPKPRHSMPTIGLDERTRSYAEVELGFDEATAVAEASRCLSCGLCSECLACEKVCQPGAIDHTMREAVITPDVGAVIAVDSEQVADDGGVAVYRVGADDTVGASAVAARVITALGAGRAAAPIPSAIRHPPLAARIGVFICKCGDEIAGVVDVPAVAARAAGWPGVVYAAPIDFACQSGGAEAVASVVSAYELDGVVVAACSCCALDQACYGCTSQRVRCKANLGVFADGGWQTAARIEFVNIREQCAWVHANDPAQATDKAMRLVAAAVAKLREPDLRERALVRVEGPVLVWGRGKAAEACASLLARQGMAVVREAGQPVSAQGSLGAYTVTLGRNGASRTVSAGMIVLAPVDAADLPAWERAFDPEGLFSGDGLVGRRPGLFACPPNLEAKRSGAATAAQVMALLGRSQRVTNGNVAQVDPARCRACGTCESLCEFGAIAVRQVSPAVWHAVVNPVACAGCGTCAAHCPSGAITAGYSTDTQIEAMLEELLSVGVAC